MLSKSIVEKYLNAFVNHFHQYLNDGVRLKAHGIVYDNGVIVCVDVQVTGQDSISVDMNNVTFSDAVKKTQLLEESSFAVMENKRAVLVFKNKVIIFKKEDNAEWTSEAANSDIRKVVNVIKRK